MGVAAIGLNDLSFPRQARILKTDDFSSVFNFRKSVRGQFLAIHYAPNRHDRPRLGLVVAKKVVRRSVDRNYARRVLRTLFRQRQARFGALDLVIRVQRLFGRHEFDAVQEEFDALLGKLQRRVSAAERHG